MKPMFTIIRLLFPAVLFFGTIPPASADLLIGNLDRSPGTHTHGRKTAQSFLTGDYRSDLTSFTIKYVEGTEYSGTVAALYNANADGTLGAMELATFNPPSVDEGNHLLTYTPATPFRLVGNTKYWLLVSKEGWYYWSVTLDFSYAADFGATLTSTNCAATFNFAPTFDWKYFSLFEGPQIFQVDVADPVKDGLAAFTANPETDKVVLEWQTDDEVRTSGFNVWRGKDESGAYEKINASLVPAQGAPGSGASYSFEDDTVAQGKGYYYKLEYIDVGSIGAFYGPVFAEVPSSSWRAAPNAVAGGMPTDRVRMSEGFNACFFLSIPAIFALVAVLMRRRRMQH